MTADTRRRSHLTLVTRELPSATVQVVSSLAVAIVLALFLGTLGRVVGPDLLAAVLVGVVSLGAGYGYWMWRWGT